MATSFINRLIKILNAPVKRTNWYKNQLADRSLFYEKGAAAPYKNIDIINIGSSSGLYAFDYNDIGIKGLNWASRPQSIELGFKLIRQFPDILKRGGVFCIPICPFSGIRAKWIGKQEENKYFGILEPEMFNDYSGVSRRMNNPLFATPKTAFKRILKDESSVKDKKEIQLTSDSQFDTNARHWIDAWTKEFNIEDLNRPVPEHLADGIAERIRLIKEIASFCKQHSIRFVLVIPPIHSSLNSYFTPEFKAYYMTPLLEAARQSGAEVIDMMNDESYEKKHFYNAYFLNTFGARQFTSDFLNKIGLVGKPKESAPSCDAK